MVQKGHVLAAPSLIQTREELIVSLPPLSFFPLHQTVRNKDCSVAVGKTGAHALAH